MLDVTTRSAAALLSPRQLEVLELLRAGLAPKEIASRLEISVWTVRSHIESARWLFRARTTAQLLALYARTRDKRRTA